MHKLKEVVVLLNRLTENQIESMKNNIGSSQNKHSSNVNDIATRSPPRSNESGLIEVCNACSMTYFQLNLDILLILSILQDKQKTKIGNIQAKELTTITNSQHNLKEVVVRLNRLTETQIENMKNNIGSSQNKHRNDVIDITARSAHKSNGSSSIEVCNESEVFIFIF